MELSDYRQQIDGIDSQLLALFYQRMEVAAQIAGDICRDNGNSAVAGVSELAAKATIIALAMPLIKSAVTLAKELINI